MKPAFPHLTRRSKTLLTVAGVALLIIVVAGVLLAFNSPLQTRLARALSGAAVAIDWKANGYTGSLRPNHTSNMCLTRDDYLMYNSDGFLNGLWSCTNDENRIWYLIPLWSYGENDQQWLIYTKKSRISVSAGSFALNVPNATMDEDASVIAWPIDTKKGGDYASNERWRIVTPDGGQADRFYWIKSVSSDKCLSVKDQGTGDGAGIVQRTCNSEDKSQLWQLDQ